MHCTLHRRPAHLRPGLLALLTIALLAGLLWVAAGPRTARAEAPAQEGVGSYTVQPGDTLSTIAARFGVSVDNLIAVNGITNPDLVRVGQILIIPGASVRTDLSAIPAGSVRAQPGETLGAVAARLGQDALLLSALNNLTVTARLFPGQPLAIPLEAVPADPVRFGAITAISMPDTIEQGRTGRLIVETTRPLTLTGNWNGLALPFAPLDVITRQVALLPAPALLGPGDFPVLLSYTTRSGIVVTRTLPLFVADGGYEQQVISVPQDRQSLLDPEAVAAEEAKVWAAWSAFTPDLVLRVPFVRPMGVEYPTTSAFGTRRFYDSGPNSYNGYHAGQDFGAGEGSPVATPALGIVTLAELLGTRGNAVIIDHGRGVFSGYWHLSELRVQPGQVVQPGEILGLVGNTGLSTGAHLHWELRITGIAVDPMQFLDEAIFPQPS